MAIFNNGTQYNIANTDYPVGAEYSGSNLIWSGELSVDTVITPTHSFDSENNLTFVFPKIKAGMSNTKHGLKLTFHKNMPQVGTAQTQNKNRQYWDFSGIAYSEFDTSSSWLKYQFATISSFTNGTTFTNPFEYSKTTFLGDQSTDVSFSGSVINKQDVAVWTTNQGSGVTLLHTPDDFSKFTFTSTQVNGSFALKVSTITLGRSDSTLGIFVPLIETATVY